MRVTDWLASFFIEENLRDRTVLVEGADRLRVSAAATFAGFSLGMLLIGLRRRTQNGRLSN